jgi:hypothetical protein
MFIASCDKTNNVYYVDTVNRVIEFWAWDRQKIMHSKQVTDTEMIEFLMSAYRQNYVPRNSDELKKVA